MLSNIAKLKKVVLCLPKDTCVLYELHLDISYSGIGYEFNVNESTFIFKLGVFKHRNM